MRGWVWSGPAEISSFLRNYSKMYLKFFFYVWFLRLKYHLNDNWWVPNKLNRDENVCRHVVITKTQSKMTFQENTMWSSFNHMTTIKSSSCDCHAARHTDDRSAALFPFCSFALFFFNCGCFYHCLLLWFELYLFISYSRFLRYLECSVGTVFVLNHSLAI